MIRRFQRYPCKVRLLREFKTRQALISIERNNFDFQTM